MNQSSNNSTPVVVLQSVHHGGLGIVRSLGRLGVPVYTIDPDSLNPARLSRYCCRTFRCLIDADASAASLEKLIDVALKIGPGAILIPTTDAAALFVADHSQALKQFFRFPDQP